VALLRGASLLVLVLLALPFVARELRLALYPQLERAAVAQGVPVGTVDESGAETFNLPVPGAAMEQAPQEVQQQLEEKVADLEGMVSRSATAGARTRASSPRSCSATRRATCSRPGRRAGLGLAPGDPGLERAGAAEQTVRLVVTPVWLTACCGC